MVYLAEPIDQTPARRSPRISRLKDGARELLVGARLSSFQPGRAYQVHGQGRKLSLDEMQVIDRINQVALNECAGLLAVVPLGVATLGTPVEVERALLQGKPVVILCDAELIATSVQVNNWASAGAMVVSLETLEDDPHGTDQQVADFYARAWAAASPQDEPSMPYVRADLLSSVPTRAYPDDAGLDLAACESVTIEPMGRALVRTGLRFALPEGMWGLIVGRSSAWHKRGIDVKLGVIDAGWRGELLISVHNPSELEKVEIEIGDRLAQYIVLPAWTGPLREVTELPAHARGTNGFGSSGR